MSSFSRPFSISIMSFLEQSSPTPPSPQSTPTATPITPSTNNLLLDLLPILEPLAPPPTPPPLPSTPTPTSVPASILTSPPPPASPSPPPPASPSQPLSAVDNAKRAAEQFTRSQLAGKRARTSPTQPCESPDDASSLSNTRYQKRLQKNRDSAFVSRIRRREYTRLLEQSLNTIEREKQAAIKAYTDMKRQFNMAMAELSRLKADLSLVSLMRASNDAGHENHPVPASPSSAPSSPRARGNDGEPEIRGGHGGAGGAGHNGTGGPAISSFFMVVLLFGLMMPEVKLFQSSNGSQGLLSLTSTHLQHKAESPPYFEKSQTDMENDLWQRLGELTTFSAVKRKRKRGDVGMVWKMASEIPSANGCTDEEKVNNKATTLNPSETDAELIITRVQDAFVQVMRDAVADTHRLTGKWTCLYFFKLAHRHLQTLPKEEVVAVGGRVNEKLNKWKGTGERGRGRGVLEAVREIVLTAEGRMMMSDLKIQEQQLIASFSAVSA